MTEYTTLYTERDGLQIAREGFGDGPADLIMPFGLAAYCDPTWDVPQTRRAHACLAQYFRVIVTST